MSDVAVGRVSNSGFHEAGVESIVLSAAVADSKARARSWEELPRTAFRPTGEPVETGFGARRHRPGDHFRRERATALRPVGREGARPRVPGGFPETSWDRPVHSDHMMTAQAEVAAGSAGCLRPFVLAQQPLILFNGALVVAQLKGAGGHAETHTRAAWDLTTHSVRKGSYGVNSRSPSHR